MQDKNTLAGLCAKNAYLLDTIVHVYETVTTSVHVTCYYRNKI